MIFSSLDSSPIVVGLGQEEEWVGLDDESMVIEYGHNNGDVWKRPGHQLGQKDIMFRCVFFEKANRF